MRIGIMSAGNGWHARDLRRAAAALGHDTEAVDFRSVQASLPRQGTSLDRFDTVLVRTMPPGSLEQIVLRMDILHRLQAKGTRVLNPPRALEVCIDKYLACARLDAAGVPVPKTVACQDADAAMAAFAELGGDVVVKPLFGSEGRGMTRVSDADMAWRVLRALEQMQSVLYLQEFIPHDGWDLRVLVIGDRPAAAMRRHAHTGWRTNVAQGGRAEAVTPTPAEAHLALTAAKAVGAPLAGVDLLPNPGGGYVVLEVNAVPGWRALAATTGVDIATAMIRYLNEAREHSSGAGK